MNDEIYRHELADGCKDINLAKYSLACRSHEKCLETIMELSGDDDEWVLLCGATLGKKLGRQEMLRVLFNHERDSYLIALFLTSEETVVCCTENIAGTFVDVLGVMSISNFFKYLNTIPNLYAFTESGKMDNQRETGLQLLSELAQYQ